MLNSLFVKAIASIVLGIAIISTLLFLPAGTLLYWNAWLLIGILFISVFTVTWGLTLKNPNLLKKRLQFKEKYNEQNLVIKLSSVMLLIGLICAGLDFRFKWIVLPDVVSVIAAVAFVAGFILYAIVLKQNPYLSRTVEVVEEQKVVNTGMYGVVRHPMYSATVLLFLSIPLLLGSLVSFTVFLAYPFIIAVRINHEEKLLEKELAGYAEYKKAVKYKIIPFIW